jgi:GTP diphosphokinase / guanosine-3',5'-bis(diphosphate) 3'-diphosphatase
MIRINDILDRMLEYNSAADLDIVEQAYVYSARVHEGQVRLSGEPYLSHPLEVAGLLADMRLDAVSVAAGLLHDVVEDTHATEEEIATVFGDETQRIVAGVTKLSALSFGSSQERQAESIRKMILAMADDIRVILIKLADRIHNMRTLKYHKEAKRRTIAQETLDIYAPIAGRLGIYWIKKELEDSSFSYLQPDEFHRIKNLVSKGLYEGEKYIDTVRQYIVKQMDAAGLKAEILGRYKHFYSINQKMMSQNLPFEEIYDIIAFRIILDTMPQCYEALGLLHALWKPIPKKFKDYIGVPKPNMYQSLHTTVIGPIGERIELQIRTKEMDMVAKSGIAAHWSYKEGKKSDDKINQKFAWIQSLVETQETFSDPDEFLENVRIDLFPDEVYVFTPQGDIKSLPRGATPVDFAYMIHTEVGNQCVGAKVDGRMVPLKYKLQSGSIVEVVTAKSSRPSKDWLNFVKTVKARSKIRQWIKIQEKTRSISLGREMCEKAFRKYRLNFNTAVKTKEMDGVVEHFGFKTSEDLIASVGYGKITPLQVIRKYEAKPADESPPESIFNKLIGRVRKKKPTGGVLVSGVEDILIRFGKCCQPVPGDSITGYITRGYGVTIHRASCLNATKMSPERQIDVQWDDKITDTYKVKIKINAYDRVGLLADVTSVVSQQKANILTAQTNTGEDKNVEIVFTLAVMSKNHLDRVMGAVKKVRLVHEASRISIY